MGLFVMLVHHDSDWAKLESQCYRLKFTVTKCKIQHFVC